MKTPDALITSLSWQLRLNGLTKAFCLALSSFLLWSIFWEQLLLQLGLSGCLFMALSFYYKAFSNQQKKAVAILHQRYPSLEFSLELWNKKEKSIAEHLQWDRILVSLKTLKAPIIFGTGLSPYLAFLLLSAGIATISTSEWRATNVEEHQREVLPQATTNETPPLLKAESVRITITPPAYTQQATQVQKELSIRALEGSSVSWTLEFNTEEELAISLVDAEGNALSFQYDGEAYAFRDRVTGSGIYAIRASLPDSVLFETEYYPLEVYADHAPVILPNEVETYRYHFSNDPDHYTITAMISDDYMVAEAFLVATLASGSGENVRFRKVRIPTGKSNFKEMELTNVLKLSELDFKPGEELYYYWAALDNKQPQPNLSRSDTYFIQFVDSTGLSETQLAGMAVNVLPEYFRSQRQIIIDTEKLTAQRGQLKEDTFNSTSNEIGFDQKLLRMRYGQYLGEEFESDAGGATGHPDGGDVILESFMHLHDQENNESGSIEKIPQGSANQPSESLLPYLDDHHDHQSEGSSDSDLSNLLEQYLHNHDSEEMNTYFEESTRALLKMAMEQMWQSELHLRLFEPEKALPFQHKALEYLKSVQQKTRTYVQRTGFDPPPIREEEKRLSGELEGLEQNIEITLTNNGDQLAPLAAELVGLLQQEQLSENDRQLIQDFSNLWLQRLQYTGLQDWSLLLSLQKLLASDLDADERNKLTQKLLPLLPSHHPSRPSPLTNQDLEKAFWNQLQ